MKGLVSFIVGVLFAIGLGYSGMTKPDVVKGFLDIFGNWDPSLIGVMIGAILVHGVSYQVIKKRSSPLLDSKFYLPVKKAVDKKLVIGSILFGVGWGWAGICPGPAVVSLASGKLDILVFVISMLTGMFVFKVVEKRLGLI